MCPPIIDWIVILSFSVRDRKPDGPDRGRADPGPRLLRFAFGEAAALRRKACGG